MKDELSAIYFDDAPVTLMGDEARPPLSRIVRAGGKRPATVDVVWLTSPADVKGKALAPEEIVDRTAEPTKPIYLRSVTRVDAGLLASPAPPALGSRTAKTANPAASEAAGVPPVVAAAMPFATASMSAEKPEATTSFALAAMRAPPANSDPVIAQLGAEPKRGPSPQPASMPQLSRQETLAKEQAFAEEEAEQRQEEDRDQENALQDEQEALSEAEEDSGEG